MRLRLLLALSVLLAAPAALATQSSKTTCETLLADNTSGAISPQDLRDCTTESVLFLDGTSTANLVVNEAGAPLDVRIEGDTNDHLFFVDGSGDAIGIGTNAASAGFVTSALPFRLPDGTASTPAIGFQDAGIGNDQGFFWDETNDYLGVSVDGITGLRFYGSYVGAGLSIRPVVDGNASLGNASQRWGELYVSTLKNTGSGAAVTVADPLYISQDGSAASPRIYFADDTLGVDHGFFWNESANALGFSVDGVARVEIDSTHVRVPDGTAGAPGIAFTDDTLGSDHGIFWDDTDNEIGVSVNGVEWFAFDSTGARIPGILHNGGSQIAFSDGIAWGSDNAFDIGSASARLQDLYTLNVKADDAGTAVTIPAIDNDGSPVAFSDSLVLPDAVDSNPCDGNTLALAGQTSTTGIAFNANDTFICRAGNNDPMLKATTSSIQTTNLFPTGTTGTQSLGQGTTTRAWGMLSLFTHASGGSYGATNCDAAAETGQLIVYDDGVDEGLCFCADDNGTVDWISLGPAGHTCP